MATPPVTGPCGETGSEEADGLRRAATEIMTAEDPGGFAAVPARFAKEESEASLCLRPKEVAAMLTTVLATQGKPHEIEDAMIEISPGGGVEGNQDAGSEVGAGSGAGDAYVRKLEMRVKMLEAEIQKMKKEHFLLQLNPKDAENDCEAATTETRAVTQVRSQKLYRADDASDTTAERHISSLGDDLLLEIFLRLPSLATLVRAALTCHAWRRAVTSSPAFRRRFRELHPAPVLGLFFETPSVILDPTLPAFPSFVPVRRRDRDLTAAVRHGDFFLTSLQGYPDLAHSWDILDCRGGYALVMNGDQATLAVVNPLARRSERFFDLHHGDILEDSHGFTVRHNPRLIWSDQDPNSFRVVRIAHDESRVRATVFSSKTGEWSILPWADLSQKPASRRFWLRDSNMQANGSMYWVYSNRRHMVKLDTETLHFCDVEVPRRLWNLRCSFVVGETNDESSLWTELGQILGDIMHNCDGLKVVAVRDGIAYLATMKEFIGELVPSWFFSLCLKTMKLEKLFERTNDTYVHPYVMTWPPSLAGSCGRFAHLKMLQNMHD
ncbi:hypothetical protein PR202_gb05616 [Eleusine coracana subsp. coracana]|uniref:F-box domain-containing protein n=1 Tax=Eleusine coracana subsp. coracana TaxID=191504 RepID=A0AAV5E6P5_ELECO|nr:hypothetical protein PR202_gb05616 [Eleusine coracana subsp. coracana]